MESQRQYKISATSFYNVSKCQRRVYLDLYGNPEEKGACSDFLQLLWERGVQIEKEIIDKYRQDKDIFDVKGPPTVENAQKTIELMKQGVPLIYQGVLIDRDHIGRPDLLEKKEGVSKLGKHYYIPCDIKSGRATKSKDSDEVKTHYANQIIFYSTLLEKIQGRRAESGKIIAIEGEETVFSFDKYKNEYERNKEIINSIVYEKEEPEPIVGGICKECVWCKTCLKIATDRQDPTLLFKLGKQKYQLREKGVNNIEDLSKIDIAYFLDPANKMYRVGEKTLQQWKRRANIWLSDKPVIHTKPSFRYAKKEVYYDIEDDPSIDHIYLHGFIEIYNGKKTEYKNILAPQRQNEEMAARKLWDYIDSLSDNDVIYHYGSYEKTKVNRLMEKYNLPEDIMQKFDRLRVDLYRVLESSSDWPLSSYGIKSIAKYLDFNWTTEDASGANSIAWYTDYRKDPSSNQNLLKKLLTYNKEDCEAMIVIRNWF